MKKQLKSTLAVFLALVFVTMLIPAFSVHSSAALNINGGSVSRADYIFDPGHGGYDPGACLGSRRESDDVLRMAKRVAQLMIASGATVAFTRTTDVFVGLSERANIQKAGSYRYFVSFHRNAASGTAYGIETYHYPGCAEDQAFATAVQNALVALNVWRNRGVKSADYAVLRETNICAILIEMGFIDNPSDNAIFDNNFEAMAKALASVFLKHIGKTLVSDEDKTPPTVSDVKVSNVSKTGYTVTATVKDNVKVTSVKFPTWTATNGQDDIKWLEGSISGNTATCNIKVSDFGNKMDTYITHVYAYDAKGNSANASAPNTLIENTPPTITNVQISNVTINGYTVTFTATDNVGVTAVKVPIWTSENGQDDLIWHEGVTKSGNNYTFNLNVKDHGYESGTYITHIYAYDALGNQTNVTAPNTVVPEDAASTIVVSNKIMITDVNGDQYQSTGAYLWTTGTFKAVWWRVLACVPDGRNYKVTAIYEANTGSKEVNPPSGGFLIAVHAADNSYAAACKVNVGDHFVLRGVKPVAGATPSSGAYAGFGEFKSEVEAKTLVPTSSSKIKVESDNTFSNVTDKLTVSAFFANFNSNTSTKKIFDKDNKEVTTGYVGTGCTVKLLDSTGKELNSYKVQVMGDVDGDGQITANDYSTVKISLKATKFALSGLMAKAADTNGDGRYTTSDYIAIKRFVQGKYKLVK